MIFLMSEKISSIFRSPSMGKKEFSNFINKIESQKIETNAIEYMFNFANEKLSSNALQLLKNIYEKVV